MEQREPVESEPSLEARGAFAHARARASLARLAPWLARAAAARARELPEATGEDLAQSVLTSSLARLERSVQATGSVPEWCQSEERLRAYLGGALARHDAHRWRGHHREVGLPQHLPARESAGGDEPCPWLGALAADERRVLLAEPPEREGLARELGCSRATLQKRRSRTLLRLRARCQRCAWHRDGLCSWSGAR